MHYKTMPADIDTSNINRVEQSNDSNGEHRVADTPCDEIGITILQKKEIVSTVEEPIMQPESSEGEIGAISFTHIAASFTHIGSVCEYIRLLRVNV